MKAPTDPKERSRAARLAVERQLARKREAQSWRVTQALIKRVSGSSLAFLGIKRKK
jgi:hypothetical protein